MQLSYLIRQLQWQIFENKLSTEKPVICAIIVHYNNTVVRVVFFTTSWVNTFMTSILELHFSFTTDTICLKTKNANVPRKHNLFNF